MYELTILIITLAFIALAWRSLPYALAVLLAALPAYQLRFSIGPVPSTLLEVMILILFGTWVVRMWQARELPGRRSAAVKKCVVAYPFWRETIALLVIAFVSAGIAGFSNDALGILKAYFIEPVMVFIVAIHVFKEEQNRPLVFGAMAAGALWVALVAWLQFLTGDFLPAAWQGTGRMTGPFPYPNALGLYLGPLVPLLLALASSIVSSPKFRESSERNYRGSRQGYVALFLVMTAFLAFGAIVLAKSDGAMIGVAAALAAMGLLHSKRTRLAVIAVVVMMGAAVAVAPAALQEKLYKKVTFQDLDGQIRLALWHETWQMLTATPARIVFGAGLANFQAAMQPYHVEGIFYNRDNLPEFHRKVVFNEEYRKKYWQPVELYLYPHTLALNFWSELGLAGLVVIMWLMLHYVAINIRAYRASDAARAALHLGLLGAMAVIAVHGLVDVPYFKNDLAVLFWVLLAIGGTLSLEKVLSVSSPRRRGSHQ